MIFSRSSYQLDTPTYNQGGKLHSGNGFYALASVIDGVNALAVIYSYGESFLCERAFLSTAVCRYACVFTGRGKTTGNVMNASHPQPAARCGKIRWGVSQIFGIRVPMMGMNYVPPTGDSTRWNILSLALISQST